MPYPDNFSSHLFDHAMRETPRYHPPQIAEIRTLIAKARALLADMAGSVAGGQVDGFEDGDCLLVDALDEIEAGISQVQRRMEDG